MKLHLAGYDQLGRRVHLGFAREFADIRTVALPSSSFLVLLGGDTTGVPIDLIYSTAECLLDRGAAYILCWGDGATVCEDIVDEAAAMRAVDNPDNPIIMTTAHEGESLDEVLRFATTVAVPAEPLTAAADLVLIFHENVSWYSEAHNVLEEVLRNGAA
ncbi:MAG: hypothetical protein JO231_21355 [Acidobacteria bacterium]|nr:hypothetical protein [Acidobacteriota bacterium]